VGNGKEFFEIYRQFGHAPSKRYAMNLRRHSLCSHHHAKSRWPSAYTRTIRYSGQDWGKDGRWFPSVNPL